MRVVTEQPSVHSQPLLHRSPGFRDFSHNLGASVASVLLLALEIGNPVVTHMRSRVDRWTHRHENCKYRLVRMADLPYSEQGVGL